MLCTSCRFDNPAGMKFCGQCGSPLERACPRCQAPVPAGFRFCGQCGERLEEAGPASAPVPAPAPAPAPQEAQAYTPPHLAQEVLASPVAVEGERKLVSVLFCDVIGSTALAERLGAEPMHGLLSRFFAMALAEVHRYEGTVNQFLGDGFMALFGAPVAHEDHARRAVLAASSLLASLRAHHDDLVRDHGAAVEVRMGINTGLVVVGGIGDRLRMDYTAVGDTTNLAARLQQVAEPGTVLLSEATMRLVRSHVRARRLAPITVKGKQEPLTAYRLLGTGDERSGVPAAGRRLTPLVGRRRELGLLEELWREAAAGQGQVAGVMAPPGAGKTRLVRELRGRLERLGATWLRGACESFGGRIPYLPLEQVLRGALRLEPSLPPAEQARRVREGLAAIDLPEDEVLSLLLRLLGASSRDEDHGQQGDRQRTFDVLRQVLLALSRREPLVIEIEDLHWIDETSEDFLDQLVDALPGAPLLLLLTYRTGYRVRWLERSCTTQIPLRYLGAEESRTLLAGLWQDQEPPEEVVRQVLERSEGNPFFLEELGLTVRERRGGGDDAGIPQTVHGVLTARIDRLPEDHKRLLQAAAVLGRKVESDVLKALWARQPGASPPLAPLLQDLKRWEFLHERALARPPQLVFRHALLQEVSYQSLLSERRRSLHGAAARALEAVHAGQLEPVYDQLAHHYPRAGETAPAVRYLARTADRAARRTGFGEAVQALGEALELADSLPEGERDRTVLELVVETARWLLPLARFPESLALLDRHRERVERVGDAGLAGRFHFWLAHTHSYLGDQQAATASARRAIAAAHQAGDAATEGKAYYVISRDGFWAGRFAEGLAAGERAVERLAAAGEVWWVGQAHWVNGFHHFVLGRPAAALAEMARAEAIAEELDDYRLDPSWSTGYFLAVLGDWEAGIEHCRRGLERAHDPLNTAAALGFLGHAWLEKGDPLHAAESLERAVALLAEAGFLPLRAWFQVFLAEAYLARGDVEDAARTAREAAAVSREAGFRLALGLARRTQGRLATAAGHLEEAGERLDEALEVFRTLGVPLEQARVHLDRARLAARSGRTGGAAAALAAARAALAGMGTEVAGLRAETEAVERELLAGGEAPERASGERPGDTA